MLAQVHVKFRALPLYSTEVPIHYYQRITQDMCDVVKYINYLIKFDQ